MYYDGGIRKYRIAHLIRYLCNFKRKEWCKGGEVRKFFSNFVGKKLR